MLGGHDPYILLHQKMISFDVVLLGNFNRFPNIFLLLSSEIFFYELKALQQTLWSTLRSDLSIMLI